MYDNGIYIAPAYVFIFFMSLVVLAIYAVLAQRCRLKIHVTVMFVTPLYISQEIRSVPQLPSVPNSLLSLMNEILR